MKTKIILLAVGFAACASLDAATLSVGTAVQTQPDPSAPVLTLLKAGAEEPTPSNKGGPVPAGWNAVEVPGPFVGYVKNRDLTKQLDVLPGSTIYLAPKDGAGVLTVFEKGDKAEITGLRGGWTQVRLEKPLVGYIRMGSGEPAPAAVVAAPTAPAPASPPPSAPATPAAASSAPALESNVPLSHLYEGTLAPTQSLLAPRRPFDWQLLDSSGKRIAFVDLSKLLLTEQIGSYSGRAVVVLGSIKPVKQSDDLVIEVDGFRLK